MQYLGLEMWRMHVTKVLDDPMGHVHFIVFPFVFTYVKKLFICFGIVLQIEM